ncbi:AraC family transcriptional regulator [Streptococcus plurextorum]|uniref:AraC family transcriptional regulator n=1 Tax=Streptococcus plurextorum TaxID=456876 RepID=UPI00041B5770|nr:AraC family transcriptional regulator [Streptococcus plurextorum]
MKIQPEFYVFNNRSYVDFYPVQFGMEACKPLHSFGPTMRQHYLFHYIISGSGTFYDTSEQRQYRLKAGQGFLICPNTICSYEADKDNPWTYIWIEFDGLKTEHFLHQAGLSKTQPIFSQHAAPTESPVYHTMKQVLSLHHQKSSAIIGHLYLFISNLIDYSLTKTTSHHNESKEFYIREAINFVERNYEKAISVDDLAQVCNLNRHYFSRLFKEQMNISPQQFIIQYRLSEACELLKNTDKTLQEIAEAIGYSNQFNFSTAFKRHYQISPQRWRKTYK